MTKIYLIRHGETKENVAQILQGHLPGELTEKGIEQAGELSNQLASVKFDALVTSDLKRAVDTAAILNHPHTSLSIVSTPLLRERDWGRLTGKSLLKERITQFPEDVESIDDLYRRATGFLDFVQEKYDGKTVLAVGHGFFNRCIQAVVQGKGIHDIPRILNAEIRIIEYGEIIKRKEKKADDEASA